ncbi:MAG: alpha-glucan family phosphorylase, partial [Solirubrobacteraceae bacterium]
PDFLTIGIARRFATYKRNDLVLSDLDRLSSIAETGPLQIVFAGKAHPADGEAKAMIRHVMSVIGAAPRGVTVAFVENYGMQLGRLLCAGADVWLNTPTPPNEASGTSGMKAALNGVPSLSTLDGWWAEGWIDGVTGWAIGGPDGAGADGDHLYRTLEETVVRAYYKDRGVLAAMGRSAIVLNASFFSAHRMVDEYARRAYRPALVG